MSTVAYGKEMSRKELNHEPKGSHGGAQAQHIAAVQTPGAGYLLACWPPRDEWGFDHAVARIIIYTEFHEQTLLS